MGGEALLHANRVLFASPERPGEARSYLARALAAVSHTLHAPLPVGLGRRGGLMVMCVYVLCRQGSRPVNLRCFDCHDIMCLNTVTPSPLPQNSHTYPLYSTLSSSKVPLTDDGPPFL